MTKTFSIYRSSAGSGKTRTLAKEYLKLALKHRSDYFKHILAVTFTNRASQEMKDRILAYLDEFARGVDNELARELKQELLLDDATFQYHSQAAQAAVLHQYAQFSISTIDAFFQKVIRSFTREAGLVGDYRLEVEQDNVLEEVIDNLIDELGNNKELTDWVVDFARENLENERAWDVRYSLIEFAKEIFREEFKAIEEDISTVTARKGFFKDLKQQLWSAKNYFISRVSKPAQEVLQIMAANGWQPDDFKYGKNSGLFTFFKTFAYERTLSELKPPGKRIRNEFVYAENWANKKSVHAGDIFRLASEKMVPRLAEIISVYDERYQEALSAEATLKNLYVFGLIADISRKLKEYKDENNLMLLADAPKFLNGVIQDSDTPFIYEKVGSFYRNYLIDEFQDTSGMQWKNFQPLIVNSLDQGYPSLVVGDVKQAIYRWRGGDLSLLQQHIAGLIGETRVVVKALGRNFRSAFQVVNFNNRFFKTASAIMAADTGATLSADAYLDVSQDIFKKQDGFVYIQFIQENQPELSDAQTDDETADDAPVKWKQTAMRQLPKFLETLQLEGAALKDIAILVRKNDEGQQIAAYLLQYKNSPEARVGCRYDVVSNESLRIDGASTVNLLLGAMRYLFNPEDAIARAQLGYEFARIHEPGRELTDVFAVTNQAIFENNLPEIFTREKPYLKKLSLIELTETLIDIFKLGDHAGELVYLQAFQDLVLDFYNREKNDLGAFLEWWEDNKRKKSIQISGEVDAAQIITIHKSKGLQFKYVIIPFCSWGLDHDAWQAPNLWVKCDRPPFKDAGYLPVKYSQGLEQTFFSEYYREERIRTYLDNLNLLYVAFTRAEHGMIVTAPHISLRDVKKSVAGMLYNSIQSDETLRTQWNDATQIWRSGEWIITPTEKKEAAPAVTLSHYHAAAWRDKLVIRQTGASFFDQARDEQREKINYGIHMHAVLSRITTADDIDATIRNIILEGLMTDADRNAVTTLLNELFRIPQVKNWFSTEWTVRTEMPVLLPGGAENRIDRLLIKDKKAIVIDFKTGERKKTDHQQVLDYIDIMRQMNFFEVEGYLLYLKNNEVVEVKPGGKQKAVKKLTDKDQLGFGF